MEEKIKKLANCCPKEWRYGQAIFNCSYVLFPKEVNQLRDEKFDCYYNDNKVDIFLEKLNELIKD